MNDGPHNRCRLGLFYAAASAVNRRDVVNKTVFDRCGAAGQKIRQPRSLFSARAGRLGIFAAAPKSMNPCASLGRQNRRFFGPWTFAARRAKENDQPYAEGVQ